MAYVVERPNARDQQIAAKGLSTPQDAIAILLHRLVRPCLGCCCKESSNAKPFGDRRFSMHTDVAPLPDRHYSGLSIVPEAGLSSCPS